MFIVRCRLLVCFFSFCVVVLLQIRYNEADIQPLTYMHEEDLAAFYDHQVRALCAVGRA